MEVVVDLRHARQSEDGLSHVGCCQSTSRVQCEDTDDSRSHRLPGAKLWIGLNRNWSVFWEDLTQDAMKRLWFNVHAADWLQSMVIHKQMCFC